MGTVWTLCVTVAFLVDVWRRHLGPPGLLIYDRHLTDALATLDVVYGGSDLRVVRRLVELMLPRAQLTIYLRIAPEVAASRKPEDSFVERTLREQVGSYERSLADVEPLVVLDAGAPVAYVREEITRRILRGPIMS